MLDEIICILQGSVIRGSLHTIKNVHLTYPRAKVPITLSNCMAMDNICAKQGTAQGFSLLCVSYIVFVSGK